MVEFRDGFSMFVHYSSGYPDNCGSFWYIVYYNRARSYTRTFSYGNSSENTCIRSDNNIVFQSGVPFFLFKRCSSENNAFV